ncbi:MAG: hypothetical protein EOO01_01005 [Chitinophagaceae bacterium]|nr:MAG: hypothetical protein EOO01_01005 [Chitinophagaceae bacterium]
MKKLFILVVAQLVFLQMASAQESDEMKPPPLKDKESNVVPQPKVMQSDAKAIEAVLPPESSPIIKFPPEDEKKRKESEEAEYRRAISPVMKENDKQNSNGN